MGDPAVSSGVSSEGHPDERSDGLVRPYIGSGGPASPAEGDDGGISAWFPAAPVDQDEPHSGAAATAAERRRGRRPGRHRPPRSRTIRSAAGIAAGGVAVLAIGIFAAWPNSPANMFTRNCRPGGCGGTVSQAAGTAPATVSAGGGAHPTASAAAGPGAPARANPSTSATRSATAGATATGPGSVTAAGTATAIATSPDNGTNPDNGTSSGNGTSPDNGTSSGNGTNPGNGTSPATASAGPSPSSVTSAPQPTPGSTVSINATTACCTTFYIRHDDGDNRVVITQIAAGSSALDKADATWTVRAGLADSACISLESANDPGRYLRHFEFELYLDPNDGSSQFAQDATFCPRPGNSGRGYSFGSVNYPTKYIRHFNYVAYIASDGGTSAWDTATLWPDDTTWLVTQPWG
jgi:hypothetical protein